MVFCGYCGSQMPDELKFCTKCGKPLQPLASSNAHDNNIPVNNVGNLLNSETPYNEQGFVSNASYKNTNNTGYNNTTGSQNFGPIYSPEEVKAMRLKQRKADRDNRLYESSWMIGIILLMAVIVDFYTDPPVVTILLGLAILVGGVCVFKFSLKGRILTGIVMAVAILCVLCGIYQGLEFGFLVTPELYTTNAVASNSNSSSNSVASSSNSSSNNSTFSSSVDPDLKKFLDSYEDFMDDYVTFMKKYTSDPNNAVSMMSDYMEMLQKYEDFAEKADKYDPDKMSAVDAAYYLEVMTRIEKKMLELY